MTGFELKFPINLGIFKNRNKIKNFRTIKKSENVNSQTFPFFSDPVWIIFEPFHG